MRITQMEFVDLYLGEDYALFKGLKGSRNLSDPVPSEFAPELVELRQKCRFYHGHEKDPEFSLVIDEIMFRITVVREVSGQTVFILRRASATIRPLKSIGISPVFLRELLAPRLEGMVIVTGQTGAGKTSTASSILDARLQRIGGVAVTIEDPPEANLNGPRGKGRCMQIRASRRTGGFKEHLVRTLRMNPDMILLGEVREEAAAIEAVNASLNGHLIITTIHAGSVVAAIERMATLASQSNPVETQRKLANGLRMVIWQNLELTDNGTINYVYEALSLTGDKASGARSKIATGRIGHLNQDIDQQMRQVTLNPMGA